MIQNEENKTSDLKKIPGVGANMEQHEPEKLKWWYWKDKDDPERCENQ
ncbi:hypothetical protein LI221_00790 [Faecalimonas umbilicata]|nr:hypothetical protein [Faecalimonas umbilicata]